MRRLLPILIATGCWPIPKAEPCEDPQLWYAPDASGDVVWACDPPGQGWTNAPPETDTDTDADADSDADTDTDTGRAATGETGGDTDTDTDTPVPTSVTGETGDEETGLAPADTSETADTFETGDTFETADTFPTADTGLLPLPETADTADTGVP